MAASEALRRRSASDHFLRSGLGASLTNNKSLDFLERFDPEFAKAHVEKWRLACGAIMERVAWSELGRTLGYFDTVDPLMSDQERTFISRNSEVLFARDWPPFYLEALRKIVDPARSESTDFFFDRQGGFEADENVLELHSLFQSCHIVAESLAEDPLNAMFDWLAYTEEVPSSHWKESDNDVFDALDGHFFGEMFAGSTIASGVLIAGFIRLVEFLSAMDTMLGNPKNRLGKWVGASPNGRERMTDAISRILRWRIPGFAESRFHMLQREFFLLVQRQFRTHAVLGLRWDGEATLSMINRTCGRYFGVRDLGRMMFDGQDEPGEVGQAPISERSKRGEVARADPFAGEE